MNAFIAFLQALPTEFSYSDTQVFLLIALAVVDVFLVFFTTRDILLRSASLWFQLFSILLVALLPAVGFFLYLLIRPARTTKQRQMEAMLLELLARTGPNSTSGSPAKTAAPEKPRKKERLIATAVKKNDDADVADETVTE